MVVFIYMVLKKLSTFEIILLIPLLVFVFLGTIYSFFAHTWGFYYRYFIWGVIFLVPWGLLVTVPAIISSIKNRKFNFFCIYGFIILFSIFISFTIFSIKTYFWDKEMYRISGIIENYYLINGIKKLDKDDLLKLRIKENIYIKINEDSSFFIVNKEKNIVYRSDIRRVVEEDSDY